MTRPRIPDKLWNDIVEKAARCDMSPIEFLGEEHGTSGTNPYLVKKKQ